MNDAWVWPAALCLALGVFFLVREFVRVDIPPSKLSVEPGPEAKSSESRSPQAYSLPWEGSLPASTSQRPSLPMPRRFRGGSADLTKQQEAGISAPEQMNAMRNAIGLALQSDGLSMKDCIDQSPYPSVRVTFRLEVIAGTLHLDARTPRMVEGPAEVADCLDTTLAAKYEAETTHQQPFLDGYSGSVDVHATIRRNEVE